MRVKREGLGLHRNTAAKYRLSFALNIPAFLSFPISSGLMNENLPKKPITLINLLPADIISFVKYFLDRLKAT